MHKNIWKYFYYPQWLAVIKCIIREFVRVNRAWWMMVHDVILYESERGKFYNNALWIGIKYDVR